MLSPHKKDPVNYDRATLFRIVLPYAVCAIYVQGDLIVECAPILYRLARSLGMSWMRTAAAIRKRRGTFHAL